MKTTPPDLDHAAPLRDRSHGAPLPQANADVVAAVDASLGPVLQDKDILEVMSLEGGVVEVVRRGRRQRADGFLEGPLFALLREAGAGAAVVQLALAGGTTLIAGPLADGRVALRLVKAAAEEAGVDSLVKDGVLPPGIDAELIQAVLESGGVLVVGTSRAGRQRVALAVVRSLSMRLAFRALVPGPSSLGPLPLHAGATLLERARAALVLGADAYSALELAPADVVELLAAGLPLPLVASVAVPTVEVLRTLLLQAGLTADLTALFGQVAVIGHAPDGSPRLVELHGATRVADAAGAQATIDVATRSTHGPAGRGANPSHVPAEVSGVSARPSFVDADMHAGMFAERRAALARREADAMAAAPSAWKSVDPDDDPGWELAGLPAEPQDAPGPSTGSPAPANDLVQARAAALDAALLQGQARASLTPRVAAAADGPRAGAALAQRGIDPFGGLSFEPPGAPLGTLADGAEPEDLGEEDDDDGGAPAGMKGEPE